MKKCLKWLALSLAFLLCIPCITGTRNDVANAESDTNTYPLPVNGGWVFSELTEDVYSVKFTFTILKPGKVDISIRAFTVCSADIDTEDGDYVTHFSSMPWGSPNSPDTQSYDTFLNAGTYVIEFSRYFEYVGKVGANVQFTPLSLSEIEPNDQFENAMSIEPSKSITAMIGNPDDVDCYIVPEPHGTYFLLTITAYLDEINLVVYDKNFSTLYGNEFEFGGTPTKPVKKTISLVLPKGTCYVQFSQEYTSYGKYTFTLGPRKPATSISLPKKISTARGFTLSLPLTIKPANAEPPSITWKSSKKSVGKMISGGQFKSLKNGTTTVTGVNKAQKLSASTKITVTDNVYKTSKPYKEKPKGLYISTKQLRYKGSYLYIDLFLYNKTGVTIRSAEDMEVLLYDMAEYNPDDSYDGLLYEIDIGDWKPKGGSLRNNSYTVISVKVKTSGKKLNLPTGRYQATLSYYTEFYRSITAPRGSREKIFMFTGEDRL